MSYFWNRISKGQRQKLRQEPSSVKITQAKGVAEKRTDLTSVMKRSSIKGRDAFGYKIKDR